MTKRKQRPSGLYARGVVYGGSGYAEDTRGIVMGVARAGIPVQVEPMQFASDIHNILPEEEREELGRLTRERVEIESSLLLQNFPASDFDFSIWGRHRVGRTMYETDGLPDRWGEYCARMDEVWVASKFNCETFATAGVSPKILRAMPEGVNTQLFQPGAKRYRIPQARGFNFLSIFEWIQRKAPDVLLRAYLSEFKADEDVALILKTYGRPDEGMEMLPRVAHFVEREMGMRLEDAPPIILFAPGFVPVADVPRLYASADAFVLPTRGEGWGRPFMEALACECPVIATGWSGQMDFLHPGISDLIEYKLAPVPWNSDVEFSAGHRWAHPSVEHLRELMRRVFTQREEAKRKAVRGRAEMVEKWDWDVVTRKYWVPEIQRMLN
jgi:glycosyltransferase involved in cell wall biosynthesis